MVARPYPISVRDVLFREWCKPVSRIEEVAIWRETGGMIVFLEKLRVLYFLNNLFLKVCSILKMMSLSNTCI